VAIPAEFTFQLEFCQNGNHNFAGTPAKIPFPQNSQNTWGAVKNSTNQKKFSTQKTKQSKWQIYTMRN
jgi:hypothetical protein